MKHCVTGAKKATPNPTALTSAGKNNFLQASEEIFPNSHQESPNPDRLNSIFGNKKPPRRAQEKTKFTHLARTPPQKNI